MGGDDSSGGGASNVVWPFGRDDAPVSVELLLQIAHEGRSDDGRMDWCLCSDACRPSSVCAAGRRLQVAQLRLAWLGAITARGQECLFHLCEEMQPVVVAVVVVVSFGQHPAARSTAIYNCRPIRTMNSSIGCFACMDATSCTNPSSPS